MIPTEQPPSYKQSLLRTLRKVVPWLFYTGVHTFRVKGVSTVIDGGQSSGRLALEPSGTRIFKAMPIVLQWSTCGTVVTPKVGSEVGVVFLDHDENRPAIVAWQALSLAGGRPDVVEIDSDVAVRIGRNAAVTTVGDPAASTLVARSLTVDSNFDKVFTALTTIAALFNAAPGAVVSAPGTVILVPLSSTPVAKLKSE